MAHRAAPLIAWLIVLAAAPAYAQRPAVAMQYDDAASHIYVTTQRTGLLSFLGHEHVVLAHRWQAQLCWDAVTHAATSVRLQVDARSLVIDEDSARALAQLGKGPSAGQRARIQEKLHDDERLASDRYPDLRFESVRVSAPAVGQLRIEGRLTVRGVTRAIEMPVVMDEGNDGWRRFAGRTSFRQSDFGLRPESIAGVVKVGDTITLVVSLLARPLATAC